MVERTLMRERDYPSIKYIESGERCVKREQVKRINKLLDQVSQASNMLKGISVK